MKFSAVALFAGLAAAETATIFNFNFNSVNGYPIVEFHIREGNELGAGLYCIARDYKVGGTYPCEDPTWTFTIKEEQGHYMDVTKSLNGVTTEGHFTVRMNGPLSTVLQQVGESTAEMEVVS